MAEFFSGQMISTSDETNFRKSFMTDYFKTKNQAFVTALVYATGNTEKQREAIKTIKENADGKEFNEIN
jgi:hypothetical protein